MLSESELWDALRSIPLVAVGGPWTRSLQFKLLLEAPPGEVPRDRPQPLWPKGPILSGARFTPKGSFGSVYLASDAVTALLEVEAIFQTSAGAVVPLRTPPWTVFGIEGVLESTLDLTDPDIRQRLGTNTSELTGEWRVSQARFLKGSGPLPPSQLLGKLAYEAGRIVGIRYPSAKNPEKGVNLVVFSDRLIPGGSSSLQVYDPDHRIPQRLPP